MTDSYMHRCVPLSLKAIPEDTYHLVLNGLPAKSMLCDLFGALPQLTRLTCRHSVYISKWKPLRLALEQTPHVTALHLEHCKLRDDSLLKILNGCSLELCELHLNHNQLAFSAPSLMTRLAYFTNLQ